MRAGGCSLAASRKVGGPRSPRSFLQPPAASMRVGLPIPSPRSAGRPLNRIASRLQRAVTYRILSYRILFYSISSVGWTLDGSVERSSERVQSQSQALPPSLLPPASIGGLCITRTVPGRHRQAVFMRARRSIRRGSRRRSQEARRWLVAEPYQVHKLPRGAGGADPAHALSSPHWHLDQPVPRRAAFSEGRPPKRAPPGDARKQAGGNADSCFGARAAGGAGPLGDVAGEACC